MTLFHFGKQKKEKETSRENFTEGTAKNRCIRVLGSGCKSCHALYENTKKAVEKTGIRGTVEYVTDLEEITKYGVMSMPVLVIDEKVVSAGKVLKEADIRELLEKFE